MDESDHVSNKYNCAHILNIIISTDSCPVDYSNLNAHTTVDNKNHHVVDGVKIRTTCSRYTHSIYT